MFVCMWMYRVKMRAICTTKPCTTGVCVRVCVRALSRWELCLQSVWSSHVLLVFVYMYLYRVKIRTMPRMCITKPCTTGYSVNMLVQNEDESYVPDVYHGAMYYGSLCVCVCTEWRWELCPQRVPPSHVLLVLPEGAGGILLWWFPGWSWHHWLSQLGSQVRSQAYVSTRLWIMHVGLGQYP